eukprot:12408219-Karenia_brevis.AAC.1
MTPLRHAPADALPAKMTPSRHALDHDLFKCRLGGGDFWLTRATCHKSHFRLLSPYVQLT